MKIYQIDGKEKEQLLEMQQQLANLGKAFQNIVVFIAAREGVDLAKTRWNADELAFYSIDEPNKPIDN